MDGIAIQADIWFRCYGVVPNSDYLGEELAKARLANGHLEVTPELRLAGQETVFAIGDLTAIPEAKRGGAAGRHAESRCWQHSGPSSRAVTIWPATSRRRHSSCSRSARAAECRSYPVNPTSAGRR